MDWISFSPNSLCWRWITFHPISLHKSSIRSLIGDKFSSPKKTLYDWTSWSFKGRSTKTIWSSRSSTGLYKDTTSFLSIPESRGKQISLRIKSLADLRMYPCCFSLATFSYFATSHADFLFTYAIAASGFLLDLRSIWNACHNWKLPEFYIIFVFILSYICTYFLENSKSFCLVY